MTNEQMKQQCESIHGHDAGKKQEVTPRRRKWTGSTTTALCSSKRIKDIWRGSSSK